MAEQARLEKLLDGGTLSSEERDELKVQYFDNCRCLAAKLSAASMTKELCTRLDEMEGKALPAFVELIHACGDPLNWDETQAKRREAQGKGSCYMVSLYPPTKADGSRDIVCKCFKSRRVANAIGKFAVEEFGLEGFNVYFLKHEPAYRCFAEHVSAILADWYGWGDGTVEGFEEDHFDVDGRLTSSTKRRCFG